MWQTTACRSSAAAARSHAVLGSMRCSVIRAATVVSGGLVVAIALVCVRALPHNDSSRVLFCGGALRYVPDKMSVRSFGANSDCRGRTPENG